MTSVETPARIFESMIDPMSLASNHLPNGSKVCRSRFVPRPPDFRLFEAHVFDCRLARPTAEHGAVALSA